MKYILVDIDSLLYKACIRGLETKEVQKGFYVEGFNLELAMQAMTDIISPLDTDNTQVFLFGKNLSENCYNFRYIINPEYKANRKKNRPPVGFDLLVEKFYKTHNVIQCATYEETDDAIARKYISGISKGFEVSVVSIDKDFKGICDVFNPEIGGYQPTDSLYWYKQALMGDAADGIKGVSGVGQKTINKLFENVETVEEAEQVCIEEYEKKKLDLKGLYRDFLCVNLLSNARIVEDEENIKIYTEAFGKKFDIDVTKGTWNYE